MYPEEFHIDIDYELTKYSIDEATNQVSNKSVLDDDEWLKQYDIIHYHRTLGPYEKHAEVIERCKRLGITTFMDIDDHWSPGPHHPAYLIIKNNELDKKVMANLKTAENVITTTPIFAEEIRKITQKDNVFVLANAIDPTEKQFTPTDEKSDRIRIGWLGGSSHLKDLELLKGLVNKLKGDGLMDKIQFVLCGFDLRGKVTMYDEKGQPKGQRDIKPTESVWYEYEKIFTDDYNIVSPEYKKHLLKFKKGEYKDIENEPYRRVWTKPISTYAKNYNLFDISLAPIEDNIFNKVKSQLKIIEAGFHKKAIVAQDFGPYQIDVINTYNKPLTKKDKPIYDLENGNGYLVSPSKNHKQWYQHLKTLINNPEQIKILGENLYNTVKDTYSIEAVTSERRKLYLKSLKSK